jgi:hypothetical protein
MGRKFRRVYFEFLMVFPANLPTCLDSGVALQYTHRLVSADGAFEKNRENIFFFFWLSLINSSGLPALTCGRL